MENSTLFHHEIETQRLVLSGAGPVVHPILGSIVTKGVLPLKKQMTGTISTSTTAGQLGTTVLGVGTSFLNGGTDNAAQIEDGDFIYDDTQRLCRRVKTVLSNTMLILYSKFPSDLTNAQLYKIPRTYHKIYAKNTGTGVAVLNEANFAIGDTFLNSGAPVQYDASGAGAEISFELSL